MAKFIRAYSVYSFVERAHSLTRIPKERLYFHAGYLASKGFKFEFGSSVSSDDLIFLDSICSFFDSEKESKDD